jgi:hypothetical protein
MRKEGVLLGAIELPETEIVLADGGHFSVPLLALAEKPSASHPSKFALSTTAKRAQWRASYLRNFSARTRSGLFPRETAKHALAHVIGDKAEPGGAIALGLLGIVARSDPQRRNSFEHFRDEKLCLQLRHVLGYEVSINPQTKRCLKVAKHLFLDHDLAQHRSSKA